MEVGEALQAWDEGAWCLAALSIAMNPADSGSGGRGGAGGGKNHARREAAEHVLAATGLTISDGSPGSRNPAFAAQAAASVLTAAAAATGSETWDRLPPEVLIAQGEASAQGASAFASFALPSLDGLAQRLNAPGASMLDVGTGVGALAAAYAAIFPNLHVTGLDVSERVLEVGRSRLRDREIAARVELRLQSVDELNDEVAFDLAWVPAPFLPEPALLAGLPRVLTALRPGGWVMLGHGRGLSSDVQAALTKLKTLAYGGTPLLNDEAVGLLQDCGYQSVRALPTPPGAPGITVGQRPWESTT